MRNVKMMKYWIVILAIGSNIFPIMSATVPTTEVTAEFQSIEQTTPLDAATTTTTNTTTTTERPTTTPPTIDYCAFYDPVPGLQHRYLRLHTMAETWTGAHYSCKLENAFLAVPRSLPELALYMDHVRRLRLSEGSHLEYWIGLRNAEFTGPLVTSQGEVYKSTIPYVWILWDEPGCMLVNSGNINETFCTRKYSFLCEKSHCG